MQERICSNRRSHESLEINVVVAGNVFQTNNNYNQPEKLIESSNSNSKDERFEYIRWKIWFGYVDIDHDVLFHLGEERGSQYKFQSLEELETDAIFINVINVYEIKYENELLKMKFKDNKLQSKLKELELKIINPTQYQRDEIQAIVDFILFDEKTETHKEIGKRKNIQTIEKIKKAVLSMDNPANFNSSLSNTKFDTIAFVFPNILGLEKKIDTSVYSSLKDALPKEEENRRIINIRGLPEMINSQ